MGPAILIMKLLGKKSSKYSVSKCGQNRQNTENGRVQLYEGYSKNWTNIFNDLTQDIEPTDPIVSQSVS